MEEDKVEDEFASFKRRLESRTGKDDERNDALKEAEAKSDTPEASDCSSGSEGDGEVCISWLMLACWLRLSPFICPNARQGRADVNVNEGWFSLSAECLPGC